MNKAFGLENLISQLKQLSPSSSSSSARTAIARSQTRKETEGPSPSLVKHQEGHTEGNDEDDDDEAGLADVDMTFVVGEASELWTEVFEPLKRANNHDKDNKKSDDQ